MNFHLLAGLAETERRSVLAAAQRRKFTRGDTVFHEGDLGDTFHLIAKGRVAIRVTTPDGEVATLAVLGPGDAFGEQALLAAESRRTATAAALEPTDTLALARSAFMDLRTSHPEITDLLLEQLAGQVRRLTTQLAEALYLPADKRVLRRLLDLDAVYGSAEIPLTQEDLASMAGTTRPTANRALQRLVDQGSLELGRGRMRVLNREAIESEAH